MNPVEKDTLVTVGGIVLAFVEGIEWQAVVGRHVVEVVIPTHWY